MKEKTKETITAVIISFLIVVFIFSLVMSVIRDNPYPPPPPSTDDDVLITPNFKPNGDVGLSIDGVPLF